MSLGATHRIGFYGKLPSRGDFVRVGLSVAAADAWDGWVQSVLPSAQALLGEDWTEIWRNVGPWRFTLRPGLCGPMPVGGIWLPSADRVGRSFPLMIATEGAMASDAFVDAACRVGSEAITGVWEPDVLAQGLADATRPAPDATPQDASGARWWTPTSTHETRTIEEDAWPDQDLFLRMIGR